MTTGVTIVERTRLIALLVFLWILGYPGRLSGQVAEDFGDAPEDGNEFNYPVTFTTSNPNGPGRHFVYEGYYLGGCVDLDENGQPDLNAQGDDLTATPRSGTCVGPPTDDEDGILFENVAGEPTVLTQCEYTEFRVLHIDDLGVGEAFLYAYADFNRDGDWNDEGEEIFGNGPSAQNEPAPLTSPVNDLAFHVPCDALPTNPDDPDDRTYIRFRLIPGGPVLTHDGSGYISGGEVEDYAVDIFPAIEYDFGDAPDFPEAGAHYETLLARNGARHPTTGPYLGVTVDSELDGQPSSAADGDDTTGIDDEDGLAGPAFIDLSDVGPKCILLHSATGGVVDAWVDWDQSLDFQPDEYYSGTGGSPLTLPGGMVPTPMCFTFPGDEAAGFTVARFRISSNGVANPTPGGLYPDGEVEDHVMKVVGHLRLSLSVFLEGPWIGAGMSTELNPILPSIQPYSGSPWFYPGTELAIPMDPGIVDWLLLELRSSEDASSVVYRQPVLLRYSGAVVDTSGLVQPLIPYPGVDSAYVVLRHRNHLDVMSNRMLSMIYSPVQFNFTIFGSGYGTDAMKDLKGDGTGPFAMFAGDAWPDGVVDTSDYILILTSILGGSTNYTPPDVNLDGIVGSLDYNLYLSSKVAGASSKVP